MIFSKKNQTTVFSETNCGPHYKPTFSAGLQKCLRSIHHSPQKSHTIPTAFLRFLYSFIFSHPFLASQTRQAIMRLSCNGCRVLRKGCGDGCTIRPCLQWIKSPQSQGNATVFLAKFYGRAGLVNLINAGPQHLRPAIFKSLLYEACGRIVNPIYGSAGLLWSGSWHLCQAAVEAVLKGTPIAQISSDSAVSGMSPPLKACDIRHVWKGKREAPSDQLHKVKKSRSGFKSSAAKQKAEATVLEFVTGSSGNEDEFGGSTSHELESSQNRNAGGDSRDADCVSAETVEASLANPDEKADSIDVDLELTLGFGHRNRVKGGKHPDSVDDDVRCKRVLEWPNP